jgi:8-oxo-dGTP diphosphatase
LLIGYFYVINLKSKTSCKIEEDHELIWIETGECVKGLFLKHQAWAGSEALKFKGYFNLAIYDENYLYNQEVVV